MDFISHWKPKTKYRLKRFLKGLEISRSKYYDWKERYGKVNEHNASVPRDTWLEESEKKAIIDYYDKHTKDGYRRVTYMMMDNDIVAASPSSIYRVLKNAELMRKWNRKESKKGTGFNQPSKPHKHWHIDISYINIFSGMTHVRTSPYYPQSNGKKERYFQTLKRECIRPKTPLTVEDARKVVTEFVDHYNTKRLHSSIGYIAPLDKLEGRADFIHAERERKLAEARARRKENRRRQRKEYLTGKEDGAMVQLIGEMEVSSAGKQLARDSRLGLRQEIQAGMAQPSLPATQEVISC